MPCGAPRKGLGQTARGSILINHWLFSLSERPLCKLSILLGKGGMFGNVIRLSPPMNVGRGDVDQFVEQLDKSLAACSAAVVGSSR